jgi:hypothetical protein
VSSTIGDDRPDAPPTPKEARIFHLSKTAWAMVVALVALAGSSSSLLFTFLPQLKPDPRDSVAAQLSVFAMDPDVTLGDYLQRAYGSVAAAPKSLRVPREELAFPGDVVYVRTRVDGFKHRRVRLLAEIYDERRQRRVQNIPSPVSPLTALSARSVELDTPSTSTVQLFWILDLAGEPATFVRIEMFDGTRMLAVTDSPVIRNNLAPLPSP